MTPIGQCRISCLSVVDVIRLLPSVFPAAKSETRESSHRSVVAIRSISNLDFEGSSFSDDILKASLGVETEEEEKSEAKVAPPGSALELMELLNQKEIAFPPEGHSEQLRAKFEQLTKEVEDLAMEWAQMSG
jgi:hypothetical protein